MSFNTGLSGLNAATRNLNVIGHNIANANTTGMKSSRAEFAELYASSIGTAGGVSGGIGVEVAAVTQQFSQGNIDLTGNDLDLAINGSGFFNVQMNNGDMAYSRSGEFKLDREGYIVTNQGAKLLGYTVDPVSGMIAKGDTKPVQMPTASGIPAKAATEIVATLNLDARAAVATYTAPVAPATFGTYDPPIDTYATALVVYDQQGTDIPVNLFFIKKAANTWEVFSQVKGSGTDPVSHGNMTFNPDGTYLAGPGGSTTINVPSNADPANPTFPVDLKLDGMTQFGSRFAVFKLDQDGYPPGDFIGLKIEEDGRITSRYSNGESMTTWQIKLANFRNVQGLAPVGGGYWLETYASGAPIPGAPRDPSFGALRQGALESSNVDITKELVNMITAQRNYQANAQTIKTEDQVMSTLVNLR